MTAFIALLKIWLIAVKDFFAALTPANILIVVALCSLTGVTGWVKGVSWEKARLEAKAAVALSKETERQAKANDSAKAESNARIDTLNAEIARLNTQIEDNENEAHQDPAAANCGVGVGGVRRLNRIR